MATCYDSLLAASGLSGLALGGCRHIHTGWGLSYWATSARSAEWQHLSCRRPAFRRGEKVRRPCVECGAFLLCPIIPVAVGRPNAAIKCYAEGSGDFLTPPPPAEKAAARQEQAWKSCTRKRVPEPP
jgi:hypothetical protein